MRFPERKLGDIVTLQRGFDITKSEQSTGDVPIVSSSGVASFHHEYKVKGPGVVIGRTGTLGTVHYLSQDHWPHNTTLWVRDFKGNDPRFVSYFLQTLQLQIFDTGSSNPTLNRNHVHKIKVLCPEPPVQRKIAAVLSAYDDLIANNQRRIALLESMAEEIYREWFVRMRFPGHRGVSVIKGLPSSWAQTPFKDFCVLKRGYDLPDSAMQPGAYPVIASTSIKGFHNEFKVQPPVITTGRSGSLGTVLMVNKKSWPLNTALYVKDFCGNSPFFIYYTLRSLKLETFNVGAGVPTLNRNHLASLGIAVPDAALQQRFDAILGPMNRQASMLAEANEVLAGQRDALLPRLISGQLKVDHLDIQLPPAMRDKVTA